MQSIKLTLFLLFTVLVFVKISSSRVKEITQCISLVFFIFLSVWSQTVIGLLSKLHCKAH